MNRLKLKKGIIIFLAGFGGVLSLLTVQFSTEGIPREVTEQFSETALRWLSLVNPAVLLFISVIAGTLLHDRVQLRVPVLESILKREKPEGIKGYLIYGIAGGIVAGILMILIEQMFAPLIADELLNLGGNLKITPLARFLYGGITEEILLRFGMMTFIAWLIYKITHRLSSTVYWIAILVSSLIFAALHLPVVFQSTESSSSLVILYILTGNSAGGIIFGWLYWKKGLETSVIAHIITHGVFLSAIYFSGMAGN